MHNLSLVHVLLALGAAATIYLVVRELHGVYVSEWALFAPGTAALFVAAGLFLIQIGAGQPRWAFAAAAAIGLAIGLVRGMMIGVRHDHYRPVVMISRDAKLVFLAVGVGVGVCASLEIIGAYTSPGLEKVRLWAALSAVVCAVAMLGRALMLTIKLRQQS
ncbi:MAG TPA: hypothetical protein VK362_08995 [Reyranella sp.]|nr:hypothetical protein [Reyranella sp.]HLM12512.1 hypothetical protein [Reyranella sp.]